MLDQESSFLNSLFCEQPDYMHVVLFQYILLLEDARISVFV